MALLTLTEQEAALCGAVGTRVFVRAREHVAQGDVYGVQREERTGRIHGRVRGDRQDTAVATITTDAAGNVTSLDGTCTCELQPACAHPAALVLIALDIKGAPAARRTPPASPPAVRRTPPPAAPPAPPPWETRLSAYVGTTEATRANARPQREDPAQAGVALQFDVVVTEQTRGRRQSTTRVAMRPVLPGRAGWVRTGISWSHLSYSSYGQPKAVQQHWRLLNEILALATRANERIYYGSPQQNVFLDSFESRRIWDLLAEACEIGLPLVQVGKSAAPVMLVSPARVSMRVNRVHDDLLLVPTLAADGPPIGLDHAVLVGKPAHGVAWWGEQGKDAPQLKDRVLRLAPLARPLEPDEAALLAGPAMWVPAADEARFFRQYYPALLRRVEVVADDSVRLPDLGQPVLTLTATRLPGHQLALNWEWVLSIGGQQHREPLSAPTPVGHTNARASITARVAKFVADPAFGLLEEAPTGPRLVADATLGGDTMLRFLSEVLPRLAELEGVEVETRLDGKGATYHETFQAPVITFDGADTVDTVGQPDWFDLSVRITVGDEQVAFDELFVALAEERQYLILPSGTYFSLDRPEFRQLRELIVEARALEDAPAGKLRVSRFQAGLWQELAELGALTGQAAAWQESVRALTEAGAAVEYPVPPGLRAVLRPYQEDGFRWLTALYDHRLGGVLADDMGLGKTLQALALICHVRELTGSRAPFLVVAPASVVPNWASEAARFAPDLTVSAITQTRARREVSLAEAVHGADVVVTSYTLFRLEYDEYEALDWRGLILDEAQFVKNPQAQGHRCVKRLPVPFKLAITGTPMENNLIELWALLSITAPGLFARADRFVDYYRNPIEKERDSDRLAQLRRRIRPLMLRRRKSDVAIDLPEKQEQVIELELNPRHRKVYQTYLQRERQKVLGLLGDLQKNRFEIFRSLTLLRQASLDVALVDGKHRSVSSTKLDALTERISDLVAEGHRTLVFSQFTRFLDAARQRLAEAGVECCYLDGSTRNRSAVLSEFKNGTAPVFLISLKAGGFGLNLTEADYCILLDPWWNPAVEAQAVDRVHRIGQSRNVMVYRLVAKDTIEEKVMALQARKAELFSSVLDGGDFASAQLTAADIQGLLE